MEEKKVEEKPEVVEAPEMTPEQKEQHEKAQRYYTEIRRGAMCLDFIIKDIMRNKNRTLKRRAMKDFAKGTVSREVIQIYADRMDDILSDIDKKLADNQAKLDAKKPEPVVDKTE